LEGGRKSYIYLLFPVEERERILGGPAKLETKGGKEGGNCQIDLSILPSQIVSMCRPSVPKKEKSGCLRVGGNGKRHVPSYTPLSGVLIGDRGGKEKLNGR